MQELSGFDEVARTLVGALGDLVVDTGRPLWVQLFESDCDDFQLAVAPDDFPVLGWNPPPECVAMGTVASGRVKALESAGVPARFASGVQGGVRLGCVVARSGEVGWHMTLPDGSEVPEPPEEGRMLDVLRRCMQLPTPPPAWPATRIATIGWISAVVEQARAAGRKLSWSETLSLHPVVCAHPCPTNHRIEDLIRTASQAMSWESIRSQVVSGQRSSWMPAPEVAGWMDDGMFSRWVMSELPPLEELIDESRRFLEPSAARRLAHLARSTT